MTTRVTAPILLPNTPDCDYPYGEELLSVEKIQALKESFKEYELIDYEHQITVKDKPYFMQTIGDPVRLFTNDNPISFIDMSDREITVPSDTLWLTSDITDNYVEKRISNKESVAYSVTIAERSDADKFMELLRAYTSLSANKVDITEGISEVSERISTKRKMIKDFEDPVMLSVSVVAFPCVNKAMFCKEAIVLDGEEKQVNGADKMSEEFTKESFFQNLRRDLQRLNRSEKKAEEDIDVHVEEENVNFEEKFEELSESIKAENKELFESFREETQELIIDAFKSLAEDEPKPDDAVDGNIDVDDKKGKEPEKEDEEKVEEKPIQEEEKEEEESGDKKSKKGISRKGFRKRKHSTKSAQPQIDDPDDGETIMKIHESQIIKDNVTNAGKSFKGKQFDKIEYSTKNYNLVPYYHNEATLASLNNAGKHVFAESFSEEETNKAILSTEMFSEYVRTLRQGEAIFDFIDYETVYGEELKIRGIKAKKSYTSQDGHLPANYYYDIDPEASEFEHLDGVLRPVTQRSKISISDRQKRNNVFGNDLLDAMLDEEHETFMNGVYAARILGSTGLNGKSYTDENGATGTVDKQFTRRDGLVEQAGVQLSSGTDFGLDNPLELFDTLLYSLPEAAQAQTDYAFFVPTGVARAYYNYFIRESRENKRAFASGNWTPTYLDIPILTSKTLSNPEFRTMLTGGDAKVLLANKKNSKLGIGRGTGVEPERHADTSSTYYYFTMDSDAKYVESDYAAVATIDSDEYSALTRLSINGTDGVTGGESP